MDIFVPEVARDEEGVLDTVECIVQHILYMRDLSPVPIAELRTQLGQNREGITRGMKRYLLKVQKFVDSIDCIMQGLARLLKSNRRLTTVCCFLGTSTTIAREAYYIHFHGSDTVTTITDASRLSTKKHLIRQLISIWNGIDLSATISKNLYVSFEFREIDMEPGGSGASSMFSEKAEFRLKIKNNKTLRRTAESSKSTNNSKEIHINIRKRGAASAEVVASDVKVCPTKWFVVKRSIKGLKKQR